MSTANPSQSSLSNHREWDRPRNRSTASGFSLPRLEDWTVISCERIGQAAMMFTAIIGLAISGYLAWSSLTSTKLAGCGAGSVFDCGHVMSTKWSAVFGIPVSVPAMLVYLAIATSIGIVWNTQSSKLKAAAQTVIVVSALTAALAATWFISLQFFVVDHLCVYCLAAHACSLVIAGLVSWSQPVTRSQIMKASMIGLAAVGTLATLQFLSPAPKTYEIQTFETKNSSESTNQSSSHVFQSPNAEVNVIEAPVFEAPISEQSNTDNGSNKNASSNIFEAPAVVTQRSRVKKETLAMTMQNLSFASAARFNPGLLAIAMVVPLQVNQEASKTAQQPGNQNKQTPQRRLVGLNGGQIQLDVAQWPICGKQTAKTIGVEMFDYTCPHCRKTHHALKSALQRSNEEFAVLSLAVPMNSQCNPTVKTTNAAHATACDLATLSVAVWRLDSAKYEEFHDWLFTGEHAPAVAAAKSKAESLVGAEKLQKEIASGVPQQYIGKQCQLYQSVGQGVIPKMYIGNSLITGQIQSADALLQMINQR